MTLTEPKWWRSYTGRKAEFEYPKEGDNEWRGAQFYPLVCNQVGPVRFYRKDLRRCWAPNLPEVLFIGLNPSTADQLRDDKTVQLWRGFAKRWGYGGFRALNAYELVATNPRDLLTCRQRYAEPNAATWRLGMVAQAQEVDLVVACWGAHCTDGTAAELKRLLTVGAGARVHVIGLTQCGTPRHPRGVRADSLPILLWDRDEAWTPEAQKALEALRNDQPGGRR